MGNSIIKWIGIIILVPGVFISLTNWYYAIKWMCKKYKNRKSSNIDGTIPFWGGMLFIVGFLFFGLATERYLLGLAAIPFGIIIDFWWGDQWFVYPLFFRLLDRTRKKRPRKSASKKSIVLIAEQRKKHSNSESVRQLSIKGKVNHASQSSDASPEPIRLS